MPIYSSSFVVKLDKKMLVKSKYLVKIVISFIFNKTI